MTKRVLVTGGSGFIGRWAVAALAKQGYDIHLCSRRKPAQRSATFSIHLADLLSDDIAAGLLHELQPTHLLHLAWETTPGTCWTSDLNLSWAACTLNLIRAAVSGGCKRIVAVGSCAEYDWTEGGVFNEGCRSTRQHTLYGAAKAATFQALHAYALHAGVSFAWARLFHQYGPYEHPDRLVPSVVRAVLAGRPAFCTHGEQVRDFMYSPDTGGALAALLDSDVRGPVNIGSGWPVRVREVIMQAAACAGDVGFVQLDARPTPSDEPLILIPNVTRLHQEVRWRPLFSLKDGLEKTVEFWRDTIRKDAPFESA